MATRTQSKLAAIDVELPELERPDARARASARKRPFLLTDRDLELLGVVAAHRFVLATHVHAWIGADRAVSYRRLAGLVGVGLLSYRRIFHAQPGCYQITSGGLAVLDSDLPKPSIDLRCYRHDIGVVWLWLAALGGRFGPCERLLCEREMRSHDQKPEGYQERVGIPLGGYGRNGKPRVHYPDVLLIRRDGLRVAFELELSLKARSRLEGIMVGYGGEPRMTRVMYFTDRDTIARAVCETAAAFGAGELVQIHSAPGGWRAVR